MHTNTPDFIARLSIPDYEPLFRQSVTEFLASVLPYLEAIHATSYDYARLERLLIPERIITFRVVWENDAGALVHNRGYRVQFNAALGPYKGGLRFDPSVNQDSLKFLGFEQIFKNALTGLPLGGGKGGSDFDPKGKSDREIQRFATAFMTELVRHIGSNIDVPAGDIGVGAREIGYLYGAYKRLTNRTDGALTGKGTSYNGSLGRTEATGFGVVYFVEHILQARGETLAGKTVAISGAGNVATYAAHQAIEKGAIVRSLSDRGGYVFAADGLNRATVDAIIAHKAMGKSLAELICPSGVSYHEGTLWKQVAADIYLPCATQNEVDLAAAGAIAAHGAILVAEGANMPLTLDAINHLEQSNVIVAPAKAVNAGGVAVSGLEMTQNASHQPWTFAQVDTALQKIMAEIHSTCVKHGMQPDGRVDYIRGANIGGFVRVFQASRELGW